jgi:hypothetical protein
VIFPRLAKNRMQFDKLKRREFITLFGGAVTAPSLFFASAEVRGLGMR